MSEYQTANKRIARNTFLLYVRMLVSMIISLYTSRLVLNALGVEDYGIYNVVTGVVTLLAFVNGSMVSATRRYLTISIAKGGLENRRKIFSTSFYIHLGIAVLIAVFAFTIGLYFLENEMTIPESRKDIAYIVFLTSIVSVWALCVTVPHNALVVAYEKMGTFAFLSIIEVCFKLFIAIVITHASIDHLFLYALLMCFVSVLVRGLYVAFCHLKFDDVSYAFPKNNLKVFKEMLSFAGWNAFSAIAVTAYGQGLNMLLNIFFNPIVNAARGIAVQVQGAVNLLAINFQQAVNPQITKNYVSQDFCRLEQLVFMGVKFSFFLIFIISFPIIVEADFILSLWLVNVPKHTDSFVCLSLCIVMIDTMSNPFTTSIQATGRIRRYMFVTGLIQLMTIPVSYVVLKRECPPESVYIVNLILMFVLTYYKVSQGLSLLNMNRVLFIRSTLIPIVVVPVLCSFVYYVSVLIFSINIGHILNLLYCLSISVLMVIAIGLSKMERLYFLRFILKK